MTSVYPKIFVSYTSLYMLKIYLLFYLIAFAIIFVTMNMIYARAVVGREEVEVEMELEIEEELEVEEEVEEEMEIGEDIDVGYDSE